MVDDLRTQPDRDRVAALIAAADRLATPRDFEIIDRRPIRRGGVIAAIVVAVVLLGLVSITTLGGGGDATADDRIGTTAAPCRRRCPMSHRRRRRGEPASGSADPAGAPGVTSSITPATTGATATTAGATTQRDHDHDDHSDGRRPVDGQCGWQRRPARPARRPAAHERRRDCPCGTPSTRVGRSTSGGGYRIAPRQPRSARRLLRSSVPGTSSTSTSSTRAHQCRGALRSTSPTDCSSIRTATNWGRPGSGLVDLGIALLQQNPGVTWIIEGTPTTSAPTSTTSSCRSGGSTSIVAYITDHGIDPRRLTTIAKGESEPIADNATRAGRAQNRRLEVVIVGLLD